MTCLTLFGICAGVFFLSARVTGQLGLKEVRLESQTPIHPSLSLSLCACVFSSRSTLSRGWFKRKPNSQPTFMEC